MSDKEKLGGKITDEDKTTIETAVDEAIKWLESNSDAEVSDLKARKKQLEDAVQPIIAKLYAGGAGGPQPGAETESEKDEL
jgi:heat shock protein 5